MKKINLAISGCLGRMGQQLIKSSKSNKNFKLVTLTENKPINKKIAGINLDLNTDRLTITKFNDFVINISQMVSPRSSTRKNLDHFTSLELIDHVRSGTTPGSATKFITIFTLHKRIAGPLLSIFAVLIGYAVLVTAKFSRSGRWQPILTSVFYLIILNFMEGICLDYVRRSGGHLWVVYLPLIFGFLSAYAIILKSDQPWAAAKELVQ